MAGMEIGIFQADEYQPTANNSPTVTLNQRLQYLPLLSFGYCYGSAAKKLSYFQ
jgi:hypothetical protein